MDIHHCNSVYFLGIGGIGMSALARYFAEKGIQVSGYDKTPSTLTDELITEGMEIHFEEDPDLIPADTDLVVYTPAIPEDNREMIHILKKGLPLMKRAEVLGTITAGTPTIAIAGTHGKTTTSTLIAHILYQAGIPFIAFLGGISKNYHSNFIAGEGFTPGILRYATGSPDFFVVEADEFDRSFLYLHPHIAVITSTDPDHLDVYRDVDRMKQSFAEFASQVIPGGFLLIKKGIGLPVTARPGITQYTYHIAEGSDFHAAGLKVREGLYHFDLITPAGEGFRNLTLGLPGMFNLENAVAASAVTCLAGVKEGLLRNALSSYRGVRRRFDFQILRKDLVYIDDYAHHPEELKACIQAVREIYPGRRITGVFQPHLFTRTRDLADDFARSLELLDELYLLEIYPAREKEIPGVNAAMLLEKVGLKEKRILGKERLVEELVARKPQVLLTLGAGDIDQLVTPITEAFGKP
jgi:UDP-N-acetylmuramate--alanine ligase